MKNKGCIYRILKSIPVYPAGLIIGAHDSAYLAVNVPLCEGDDGAISFISLEAKKSYLAKYGDEND